MHNPRNPLLIPLMLLNLHMQWWQTMHQQLHNLLTNSRPS